MAGPQSPHIQQQNASVTREERTAYTIAAAKMVGLYDCEKDDEEARIEYYERVALQAAMMIQCRYMLDRMLLAPQSPAKSSGSYRVG